MNTHNIEKLHMDP